MARTFSVLAAERATEETSANASLTIIPRISLSDPPGLLDEVPCSSLSSLSPLSSTRSSLLSSRRWCCAVAGEEEEVVVESATASEMLAELVGLLRNLMTNEMSTRPH